MASRNLVIEALRELSDRAAQHRLWESNGEGGAEVSSFTEAVEGLFTDSGLSPDLERRATGFGLAVEDALIALDAPLRAVNRDLDPATLIASAEMQRVRGLAARALALIVRP